MKMGEYQFCHPPTTTSTSQSTNDAYPTAVRIALVRSIENWWPRCANSSRRSTPKGREVLRHHQDGPHAASGRRADDPRTGEFEAYAANLTEETGAADGQHETFLRDQHGGHGHRNGINADPDYAGLCTRYLREITGLPLVKASNMIEATSDTGAFIMNSSAQKRLAVKLSKICNDLRLLSSGPRCGLNEINLPPRQPDRRSCRARSTP